MTTHWGIGGRSRAGSGTVGQQDPCTRPCREHQGRLLFHSTRLPGRDRHHLLHPQHLSRAGSAAEGLVSLCQCSPAGVTLGHRGAGCLQPPSPFPAYLISPPLHSFPPAPSYVGPKAKGRWKRAGRGWRWGEGERPQWWWLGCRLRWRGVPPAPLPLVDAHLAGCSCPR